MPTYAIAVWWDKDPDGKVLVRAVMANLPANGRTYRLVKRRMWIETVFIPLACLATGLALARLAERGAWGRPLAWAIAAAFVFQGAALWLGAMYGLLPAPSIVPLLR